MTDQARYFGPGNRVFVVVQMAGVFALIAIIVAAYVFRWFPHSGEAAVIAALLAAVMSIHPEMKNQHKAGWMIVIGGFVWIELKAITHERDEEAKQHLQAIADERQRFSAIGRSLETSIANSEKQFRATIEKESAVLDKAQAAAELSRLNLMTMTGEGSHPCVVPQSHAAVNGSVPLVIWNRGSAPLTGVETRVLSDSEFLDQTSIFQKPSSKVDTLRTDWPKPLPEFLKPVPGVDGVAHYQIQIWTQNGYYDEVLNFRPGKYQLPWAYQYWLTKQTPFILKRAGGRGMKGQIVRDCVQEKWSDDLGDGKPVVKP